MSAIPDGSYSLAIELLGQGSSPEAVVSQLVASGVPPEAAAQIVRESIQQQSVAEVADRSDDMAQGAMWIIGGLLLTGATYFLAAGGGTYLIAFGPIIYGATRLVRGLGRS